MTALLLPATAVDTILGDVVRYAGQGIETGAFLMSRGTDRTTNVVALLGEAGIERRPDQLIISGLALALLFDWAEAAGIRVLAQVHSHGSLARMSTTDERFGLTVEGFTSAIVPNAKRPPADPSRWGWWRFRDGRWHAAKAPGPTIVATETVVFDEAGVRDG